jgi:hypothetical protein
MASSLGIRYTDERYVTMQGLRKALNTNLVDQLWQNVLAYRKENRSDLALLDATRRRFGYTKTPVIMAKLTGFETKLAAFYDSYSSLSENPEAKLSFEKECLLPVLESSCSFNGVAPNPLVLKAMVNGFYKEGEEKLDCVYRHYLNIRSESFCAPDEDSLGGLRFSLLGHDDVSSFYRLSDFKSVYTTSQVARDYTYAPFGEIEGMMEGLFSFLHSSSLGSGANALIALYYLSYVKPFSENNELLASEFARLVLKSNGGTGLYCLPFESCLKENSSLKDILQETQKYGDLTYFLLHCIDILVPFIDNALERMQTLKKETLVDEFVSIPEEKKESEPPIAEEEAKEENAPELLQNESKKAKVPLLSEEEQRSLSLSSGPNALLKPKSSLSDKEIKETARYLLETNPLLRKKQALFYASHCALGRFYTIQDFKKASRCAYETARTSMDGLAELGFYEKKQVKNKFVYTPLKQGESK